MSKLNELDKVIEKMVNNTEKEIARNYREALKRTRSELGGIFEKYAKEGELTYADMAKYNRLSNLESNLTKTLKKTTNANIPKIRKLQEDVYNRSYLHTGYEVENGLSIDIGFGLPDEKVVKASVNAKVGKLTLNQRLAKNRRKVISTIKKELTQGLIIGESYAKMAKRLRGVLEGDTAKATRVARTEAGRNQSTAQMEGMKYAEDKGIEMRKQWVATLDGETRDSHQLLDGQIKKIDENFVSPITGAKGKSPGNMGTAEEDVNCRCTMITLVHDFEPEIRRDREGVQEFQTYKEWEKNKGV